jgi:hypothetical protein
MMGEYLNVFKGFVPQTCLPMGDANTVGCLSRKGYKYEITISVVHTGVVPESVMHSVKRLIEFLKGHIVSGDQKTTLRGALKTVLPKCMLCRLGPVACANVQKDLCKKELVITCKQEQGSTMVHLTRCPESTSV